MEIFQKRGGKYRGSCDPHKCMYQVEKIKGMLQSLQLQPDKITQHLPHPPKNIQKMLVKNSVNSLKTLHKTCDHKIQIFVAIAPTF